MDIYLKNKIHLLLKNNSSLHKETLFQVNDDESSTKLNLNTP